MYLEGKDKVLSLPFFLSVCLSLSLVRRGTSTGVSWVCTLCTHARMWRPKEDIGRLVLFPHINVRQDHSLKQKVTISAGVSGH